MSYLTQEKHEAIRNVASPGTYPKVAIMGDNEVVCPACIIANIRQVVYATKHYRVDRQWALQEACTYWEGPDEECAHCGGAIHSAYGPQEEEEA
jgi:hypothetical protein